MQRKLQVQLLNINGRNSGTKRITNEADLTEWIVVNLQFSKKNAD